MPYRVHENLAPEEPQERPRDEQGRELDPLGRVIWSPAPDPKADQREILEPNPDRILEGYPVKDPWPLSKHNPLPNKKTPPHGYKKNPNNPWEWLLDPSKASAFERGFAWIDEGQSLQEVCNWLGAEHGIKISRNKINELYYEIHGHTEAAQRRKKEFEQKHRWRKPRTWKEKEQAERRKKKSFAKRTVTMMEKQDAKEREKEKQKSGRADAPSSTPAPSETKIIFKPNPGPQTEYLAASEQEVLYGGQAGGGKTMALIADPLRYFHERAFQGILVRRTIDELRDVIWETHSLYPAAFPGAKWNEKKSQWTFPSGARMWFTFLEREQDVLRYQGQAFQYIAFDELTQHPTPFAWTYLSSRLRSPEADLPLSQRAATNPGGPGHCLTHGEVLTPDRGWVDIRSMRAGDPIYSVDEGGNLFATAVDHTYKAWVEEDIVQVNARGLRMSITKDHKVAKVHGTRHDNGKGYSLVPFSDLPGQATILRSAQFQGAAVNFVEIEHTGGRKRRNTQPHRFDVHDYASFVGWYISEGCRVHRDKAVTIAQSKEEGRAAIVALLDRMGFSYVTSATGFTIYCPSLYAHVARYGDGSTQKRLTREFKNLPLSALECFFKAVMAGDGSGSYYYTISPQLKDDFAEVAFKTGRLVYISERRRKDREHTTYQISTKKTKSGGTELLTGHHIYSVSTKTKRASDITYVPYKGYVYCVGVPNTHTFVVRQDGSVWVSGNSWVKKMFIDPAPPGTAFAATDIETGETLRWPEHHAERAGQPLFYRRFIPSKLSDNPHLYKDGRYEATLLALPETQRRQLLEGDWDVVSGQEFTEFRRHTHTCTPFEIPANWIRFRSCDYGYSTWSAVHWYAIDPNFQTLYVYRELYVTRHTAKQLGQLVRQEEQGENIMYGVLDSSCWHKRGNTGPSIAEEMAQVGCLWKPADRSQGSRSAGKNRIHELLVVDPGTGLPGIIFFDTCRKIIATLPSIPSDPRGMDDVDPKFRDDHDYDSLRYGVMSRPQHWLGYNKPVKRGGYRPADPVFGY